VGNQWWDDHHLHKFGKTPEDTQHPTTQQQTYRSPINIYTKKGSSKPDEYTDIIQAHKVLTKGSSAKEQYELCCKTLTTMLAVPLTGMLLACPCHTAILDAQFLH
jgi:hypothetical protein